MMENERFKRDVSFEKMRVWEKDKTLKEVGGGGSERQREKEKVKVG